MFLKYFKGYLSTLIYVYVYVRIFVIRLFEGLLQLTEITTVPNKIEGLVYFFSIKNIYYREEY